MVLSKANDTKRGIRWILTERLEDLDYADNICLMAHTYNDVKTKLQRSHSEAAKVGMKINSSKTKEMRIHTPQQPTTFPQRSTN
jgi:hypothetical protein